jgi:hypothetical protein
MPKLLQLPRSIKQLPVLGIQTLLFCKWCLFNKRTSAFQPPKSSQYLQNTQYSYCFKEIMSESSLQNVACSEFETAKFTLGWYAAWTDDGRNLA